jgi:hypothetical protein
MTTVVYQSYRAEGVAPWIARSMETVRAWAEASGFAYERLDDAFFAPVPGWYRDKVEGEPVRMSDLARLLTARRLLATHDRAVWVDADVVIFDPARFTVDAPAGYAFCREAWITRAPDGRIVHEPRVNNAVSVFARGNPFLDFYVHACESIVRRTEGPVGKLAVGTAFLTRLSLAMPLPVLGSVALPSPLVLVDLARGGGSLVGLYMNRFGGPARAANLCSSLRGHEVEGVRIDDALLSAVLDRLVSSGGEALNGHMAQRP